MSLSFHKLLDKFFIQLFLICIIGFFLTGWFWLLVVGIALFYLYQAYALWFIFSY